MMTKNKRKFIIDLGWVLIGHLSIVIVTFLQRMFIARFMGAEELGAFSIVWSVYVIGTTITSIGVPMALTKYIAEFKHIEQKLKGLMSVGLILSGILGIIASLLFLIFSSYLLSLLNISQYGNLIILLALIFPFSISFFSLLAILNGKLNMKLYSLIQTFQNSLYLILTILFLVFGFGIKSIFIALWLSLLFSVVLIILTKNIKLSVITFKNILYDAKRLLKFGVKVFLTDL